ncbi:flavin reductase family protein [Anaeromyxobacter sp. Red801]|uniref:flavin reductase family protein n=1 Tax=Anaeromyxobacter sp. Red801 TaxID=3411632 RepID=UPI003B9DD1DD
MPARSARPATRKVRLPLAEVYRLLEPGPVVLVTTGGPGRPDVMTMSWLTMMEFEPPRVGCVISDRNHTFGRLVATRECVINVPTVELARQVVGCGNVSGRRVDKLRRFGLTAVAATKVGAPLLEECWARLECRIADDRLVEEYGFFVLEVVAAWIDRAREDPRTLHHRGRGVFAVDGELLKLPSRKK